MTYATVDDLIARAGEDELIQVTDRNRVGAMDLTVIAAALSDADNLVNGYWRLLVDAPPTEVVAEAPVEELVEEPRLTTV